MHEIVTLQVGQCGNQVGNEFWKKISLEHQISYDGENNHLLDDRKDRFFYQADSGRFIPRAILLDLEPRVINQVMPIFNTDNIFVANEGGGAGNNWAHGYYVANKIKTVVFDIIQREVEACDSIESFNLIHSVAGGTGSGFGSLLAQELKDLFPKTLLTSYSILPTNDESSDVVVQPYNSLLSLNKLNQSCDSIVIMDNLALAKISMESIGMRNANYNIINSLASTAISSSNSTIRFPGHMFCDSRSIFNCTVPVPQFKFLIPSYTPFSCDELQKVVRRTTVGEVMRRLILPKTRLATFESSKSQASLAIFNILEGVSDPSEIVRTAEVILNKKSMNFVEWMPSYFQNVVSKKDAHLNRVSGLSLNNTTGIATLLKKISSQFDQLRKRNAFLDMYKKFEADTEVFDLARDNIQMIIEGYMNCEFNSPLTN